MKQLGSIIDWGHPGQPPAAIMSRFLPKLFLRRAETDISTISRAAGREISAICYSGHHVACNFALKSFQTIPKVAACGQTQSLYFAFKGRRAFTIKGSALWILKSWNGVCVEKVNIVRECGWHPIYHTSTIWPFSTNKGVRGDVWGPVCSGYNPTICSLTWTP